MFLEEVEFQLQCVECLLAGTLLTCKGKFSYVLRIFYSYYILRDFYCSYRVFYFINVEFVLIRFLKKFILVIENMQTITCLLLISQHRYWPPNQSLFSAAKIILGLELLHGNLVASNKAFVCGHMQQQCLIVGNSCTDLYLQRHQLSLATIRKFRSSFFFGNMFVFEGSA